MNKITSVLSILVLSIYTLPTMAGDFIAVYHNCLKIEKEKLQNGVAAACGIEAASSPEALKACQDAAKAIPLPQKEAQECHDRALASAGYAEPVVKPLRELPIAERAFMDDTPPPPERKPPKPETTPRKPPNETEDSARTARTPEPVAPASLADTTAAEIEADQDIATCAAKQSTAGDCCGDPLKCGDQLGSTETQSLGTIGGMVRNGARNGGINDYCTQMSNLTSHSGSVNEGLASICFGQHATCTQSCGDLAKKYAELLDGCDGCAAQSIYENAKNSLIANEARCSNMRITSDSLAARGLGSVNNQAVADYCARNAGLPSSIPGANNNNQLAPGLNGGPHINHLLAHNCEINPNMEGCKAIQRMAGNGERGGESGFAKDMNDPKKSRDFNVADASQGYRGYPGNSQLQENEARNRAFARPAVQGTVANNTGGQMLGTSGYGKAALAPKVKGGVAALNPTGESGEINTGAASGYSQPVTNNSGSDFNSGTGYVPMGSNDRQFENMDLRQFLPGGSRAAARGLAANRQINAKEENLFLRISNKMMEKCRLGVLWQCH